MTGSGGPAFLFHHVYRGHTFSMCGSPQLARISRCRNPRPGIPELGGLIHTSCGPLTARNDSYVCGCAHDPITLPAYAVDYTVVQRVADHNADPADAIPRPQWGAVIRASIARVDVLPDQRLSIQFKPQ